MRVTLHNQSFGFVNYSMWSRMLRLWFSRWKQGEMFGDNQNLRIWTTQMPLNNSLEYYTLLESGNNNFFLLLFENCGNLHKTNFKHRKRSNVVMKTSSSWCCFAQNNEVCTFFREIDYITVYKFWGFTLALIISFTVWYFRKSALTFFVRVPIFFVKPL